jgi:serine/threonine-protein kinase HipA
MKELAVLLNREVAATVDQKPGGELVLRYDEGWRSRADSFPLSLSLPMDGLEHRDRQVRPFLEGLLPDNHRVLDSMGSLYQVSPTNAFALLTHMGEDCAGAVQLVAPDRVAAVRSAANPSIKWLTELEVAERLRDSLHHAGTGRLAGDQGSFCLAGAQPKTALVFDKGSWGIPSGAVPTTHILKPPSLHLDGLAINEHFCLKLAKRLGLPAADSTVQVFDGEQAIVVERYDRARSQSGGLIRLHQEDCCQALGVSPATKYVNEGGPGVPEIVDLLLRESSDRAADAGTFVDAQALNWAIAGTDAHAKNYSLLISAASVRLAPLYDVISALPYALPIAAQDQKLAMRIDREYAIRKISRRHWEGLASRCDLDPQPLMQRVAELLHAIPEAARKAAEEVRAEGIEHEILDRLEGAISTHSQACLDRLG